MCKGIRAMKPGPTYISHINTSHASSPVVPHAFDHLVQNLARVCLSAQRHLEPVQPPLGVFAGGALNGHVRTAPAAHLLELADDCLLVGNTEAEFLVVDYIEFILVLGWPALDDGGEPGLRVDKDDLARSLADGKHSGHLPDGSGTEDGDLVVRIDSCVLDGVVRSREDVGEVKGWLSSAVTSGKASDKHTLLIRHIIWDLQKIGISYRHAHILRLSSSKAARKMGVPKETSGLGTVHGLSGCVGVGLLTLR